jgi:hypothetical protein
MSSLLRLFIFLIWVIAHYNETISKNYRISHHLQNLSSGLVAYYNKTTFKKKYSYFSPLWKIFAFFTSLKNLGVFHLGSSPIIMRPFLKNLESKTTLKNHLHFVLRLVVHYNKTTLKNLRIFHHFENSFHFPPGHVTHYNRTTLKTLCIFHRLENSFSFFPRETNQWQFNHFKIFENPFCFSSKCAL